MNLIIDCSDVRVCSVPGGNVRVELEDIDTDDISSEAEKFLKEMDFDDIVRYLGENGYTVEED